MNEGKVLYAMFYRRVKSYSRAKSRLAGTVVNPLTFSLGMGFSASVRGISASSVVDYLALLAPVIAVMTTF